MTKTLYGCLKQGLFKEKRVSVLPVCMALFGLSTSIPSGRSTPKHTWQRRTNYSTNVFFITPILHITYRNILCVVCAQNNVHEYILTYIERVETR